MDTGFGRAVVTGGAGFLGSHLCEVLVAGRTAVVCVDNLLTGDTANISDLYHDRRFEFVCADVSAALSVPGSVDLVVHLACPASPVHYLRWPIETLKAGGLGTLCALALAREKNARFVLASTSEVYGDPLQHPQSEAYWGNVNPIGPRSVYDESKRYAEALTAAHRREHGLRTGIARIFNTFGPRMRPDDGRMIPAFICQALRGRPLTVTGDGSQTRSPCYVDDTVRGLLALAADDHPGPVNIGNPEEYSVLDIAERIRELVASISEIRFVAAMEEDPKRRCPDISVARRALNWEPLVSVDDGLKRTIEWFAR
ncbi:UDP-glucuronic acid decarboxylase family protein [Pseudonocardia acidicola]|uniref:SDR family oxidoreductase n=1 Tax=Pseudonocardia acidicola TaxID=2724939 RepID=A0ABX1S9Y0_9PSEU|nr:UDP-glucuronic acid decarboxylase family protein [Pseudonocardia acidicola]NMH98379.1 SDR family oxidoreductase [Pseudonocardia acidicola]